MKVLKKLKEIPDLFVVKVQQVAMRGIPDLLICHRGRFIAWELKTDEGHPTELQKLVLSNITKAGGVALVVSPSTLDEALRRFE